MKPLLTILLAVLSVTALAAPPAPKPGAVCPLAWNASPDANVAGYKLYAGTASGSYGQTNFVGNVTNTVVTGLADGTVYFFAATTVSTNGTESGFCNEVSVRTPRAPLKLFHR